jgi:hypothetical protein
LQVASDPGEGLLAPGVRSGVVVCAYQPVERAGAMMHLAVPVEGTESALAGAEGRAVTEMVVRGLTDAGCCLSGARAAVIACVPDEAMERQSRRPLARVLGTRISLALRRAGARARLLEIPGGRDKSVFLTLAHGEVNLLHAGGATCLARLIEWVGRRPVPP